MIRVFLAEDHPIFRDGLKHVLSQCRDVRVVGEAGRADNLSADLARLGTDVLLLDVSMPGPGVLEVIRDVKASVPRVRILVLSMYPEQHYARRVLKAGADGYLTKAHSSQELPSAIKTVSAGKKYVTSSLAEDLAKDLSRGRDVGEPHEALSNREYEVLLRLGCGESMTHIATELGLSHKTVRTYRSRILEKMNLDSTAQLIFYAVSRGLVSARTER